MNIVLFSLPLFLWVVYFFQRKFMTTFIGELILFRSVVQILFIQLMVVIVEGK